jgi:hypothetical protein
MKILFDQGTPAPLRRALVGHAVSTAHEMGWSNLENGALLAAAVADGFALIMTTDKNLRHQQNLSQSTLAILVLPTTSWPAIEQHIAEVVEAVSAIQPGEFRELTFAAS